jgi:hypothetical protein
MEHGILIFQEVGKCSAYATVMALEHHVILLLEEIPSCFISILLTVSTIGTPKVVEVRFFSGE